MASADRHSRNGHLTVNEINTFLRGGEPSFLILTLPPTLNPNPKIPTIRGQYESFRGWLTAPTAKGHHGNFGKFDKDHDGYIDLAELEEVVRTSSQPVYFDLNPNPNPTPEAVLEYLSVDCKPSHGAEPTDPEPLRNDFPYHAPFVTEHSGERLKIPLRGPLEDQQRSEANTDGALHAASASCQEDASRLAPLIMASADRHSRNGHLTVNEINTFLRGGEPSFLILTLPPTLNPNPTTNT